MEKFGPEVSCTIIRNEMKEIIADDIFDWRQRLFEYLTDNFNRIGVHCKIENRETRLIRPPVANIDQAVIVFAVKKPNPNILLLDRFLVMAERENLDIVICFNKVDLSEEELKQDLENSEKNLLNDKKILANPFPEMRPPKVYQNKVTIYPLK